MEPNWQDDWKARGPSATTGLSHDGKSDCLRGRELRTKQRPIASRVAARRASQAQPAGREGHRLAGGAPSVAERLTPNSSRGSSTMPRPGLRRGCKMTPRQLLELPLEAFSKTELPSPPKSTMPSTIPIHPSTHTLPPRRPPASRGRRATTNSREPWGPSVGGLETWQGSAPSVCHTGNHHQSALFASPRRDCS
jgi:hypothetical protein